jgi:hypothetical protein
MAATHCNSISSRGTELPCPRYTRNETAIIILPCKRTQDVKDTKLVLPKRVQLRDISHWITTHWPTPPTDLPFSRHVYVRKNRITVPEPGDIVFVREAYTAVVDGKRVYRADRWHAGTILPACKIPEQGKGGIIGVFTVDGSRRPIHADDVVFDYGDLRTWEVVPGRGFQALDLTLEELRFLIGFNAVRCLSLWRMPVEIAGRLVKRLNGNGR